MQRNSEGHGASTPPRGGADPRRVRLMALVGVVAFVLALPLAVASMRLRRRQRSGRRTRDGAHRRPAALSRTLPLSPAARPRTGHRRAVRSRTVLARRRRGTDLCPDAGRGDLGAHLLPQRDRRRAEFPAEPDGPWRAHGADQLRGGRRGRSGVCETPRERTAGGAEAYTAIAEFAKGSGPDGPLLLRSGSNSAS